MHSFCLGPHDVMVHCTAVHGLIEGIKFYLDESMSFEISASNSGTCCSHVNTATAL